jgi:two-component system NarL family sensor kinase
LGALLRSNTRQTELVESLLNAYRNDHIGVVLKMVPVDMDELIADTLTELQALATDRHLSLEYTCRQAPPKIQGDPVQLKRVLANLLHNALNYTPSGGTVQVNLVEQQGQLQVSVSDTGPGLSKQDLEQVFHRFYRANSSRQLVGTGLGLYLSRQLIHAHRGKIWAENRSPHGCAFIFTLPLAAGETQT